MSYRPSYWTPQMQPAGKTIQLEISNNHRSKRGMGDVLFGLGQMGSCISLWRLQAAHWRLCCVSTCATSAHGRQHRGWCKVQVGGSKDCLQQQGHCMQHISACLHTAVCFPPSLPVACHGLLAHSFEGLLAAEQVSWSHWTAIVTTKHKPRPQAYSPCVCFPAGLCLPQGGLLFIYGPFKREQQHTSESNAAFDASLRARNPTWGYRDIDDVSKLATAAGFVREAVLSMPANNFALVFRKR